MSLDTGAGAPSQPGDERSRASSGPAEASTQTTGPQIDSRAETHVNYANTSAPADTTHAYEQRPGWPVNPGERTRTATAPPATTERAPAPRSGVSRRSVVTGGLATLAALVAGKLIYDSVTAPGPAQAPTQPTGPQPNATGGTGSETVAPQPAFWEALPAGERVTGQTPQEVYTSFVTLVQWAANNPNAVTPGGQSTQQLLDSIISVQRSSLLPNTHTNTELLRDAILSVRDLARNLHRDRIGFKFAVNIVGQPTVGTNAFSIPANVDLRVEGDNSPFGQSDIKPVEDLARELFNDTFVQFGNQGNTYRGGQAQFVFKRSGDQWVLVQILKLGNTWLP